MNFEKSFRQRGQATMRQLGRMLKPYPLRSSDENLSCKPFFIVSTGRSGTTLLRAILTQNTQICIPPETDYLGRLISQYQQSYRRLPWRDIVTLFCGEMACGQEFCDWDILLKAFHYKARKIPGNQRSLAQLIDLYFKHYLQKHAPEAKRWGDKTPHNILSLSQIDAVFPEAQIIHIFRDGRDVAASYLQLGWVKSLEDACDMWLTRIQAALAYAQRADGRKFLEVRYEDLARTPEPIIQQVCTFLELTYEPKMLDFHQNPDKFRGDTARPRLHPMLAQPINIQAIGKWRHYFDANQQTYIQQRLGQTLAALGYENE